MAATPSRHSGRAARLRRVARRRTSAAPRRVVAPIGSRPSGRRRRVPTHASLSPIARQLAVSAPTDLWTRIQQAAGTLAALGTLAVIVFTWLSIQQVDDEHALTREGQVTDRYNAAVTNIGEESMEVRLGGIYALQRIMEDSPRDQPSIVNVLSTYIRNHAKEPRQVTNREPASDVQAALTALGSRDSAHDSTVGVSLRGAYMAYTDLFDADLHNADLSRTNLYYANLSDADLRGAILFNAELPAAYMANADLSKAHLLIANLSSTVLDNANLSDARLRGADLSEARLRNADLRGAELLDANLRDANLSGTDLDNADLSGANLRRANLRNADLSDARLRGADLSDADLRNADLSDADLRNADLSSADLHGANLRGTDLPGKAPVHSHRP